MFQRSIRLIRVAKRVSKEKNWIQTTFSAAIHLESQKQSKIYYKSFSFCLFFFFFFLFVVFFFAELHGDQRGQTASPWVKLWAKGPRYGLKQLSSNSSATVQPLLVSFSCNLKRGSCSVNCWINPVNLLMLCLKLLQATSKHLIWDMGCEILGSATLIKIIFKQKYWLVRISKHDKINKVKLKIKSNKTNHLYFWSINFLSCWIVFFVLK